MTSHHAWTASQWSCFSIPRSSWVGGWGTVELMILLINRFTKNPGWFIRSFEIKQYVEYHNILLLPFLHAQPSWINSCWKSQTKVTQFVLFKYVVYYKLRDKTVVQILVIDIGTCFALSYNVFLADLNYCNIFFSRATLSKKGTITWDRARKTV